MKKKPKILQSFCCVLISLLLALLTACATITPTESISLTPAATAQVGASPTSPVTPEAFTSTAALCLASDLKLEVLWEQTNLYGIAGKISFTNQSSNLCVLQGGLQAKLLDEQKLPLPNIQDAAVTSEPAYSQILRPAEQLFSVLVLEPGCEKLLMSKNGASDASFDLQIKLTANQVQFDLPIHKFSGFEDTACGRKLLLRVGPFEPAQTLGYAFTATALAAARTQVAFANATEAVQAKTIAALPPTPTVTAIPPIAAKAQPCLASDLQAEVKFFNGATGWSIGNIYLLNNGSALCTLQGYPQLQSIDEKGQIDGQFHFSRLSPNFDPNPVGVVGVQPGKAAAVAFWSYRCDLGSEPGQRNLKIILPNKQGQLIFQNSSAEHCTGGSSFLFGSFAYAPDNWRNLP